MKILQVVSGTIVNGAAEHVRLLSRQLHRQGHDVTVACRPGSWIGARARELPVTVVDHEMNRWPPQSLLAAARWIREAGFDVIHTHMSRAHMFGILMMGLTGTPAVATAHCQHVQPWWPLNRFVIANSENTLRFHRRFNRVSRRRSKCIHCFVDEDRFHNVPPQSRQQIRRQLRAKPNQKLVGIIGDVVPHKGHHIAFEALRQLAVAIPDLRFVVVGRFHRNERYVQQLRQFQIQHRLFRRVKWLGRRENIHQFMAAMDLVLVPSLVEGQGLVALEAMLAGTPVIAARTGGLPEVLQEGRNGMLFKRGDASAVAEAISRVVAQPEACRPMVEHAARWARETLSAESVTRQIVDVYREIVANPRSWRSLLSSRRNTSIGGKRAA